MTLTVTAKGQTRLLTDVALVRAYLLEHGCPRLPDEDWIAYWVNRGLSLEDIIAIATCQPVPFKPTNYKKGR